MRGNVHRSIISLLTLVIKQSRTYREEPEQTRFEGRFAIRGKKQNEKSVIHQADTRVNRSQQKGNISKPDLRRKIHLTTVVILKLLSSPAAKSAKTSSSGHSPIETTAAAAIIGALSDP